MLVSVYVIVAYLSDNLWSSNKDWRYCPNPCRRHSHWLTTVKWRLSRKRFSWHGSKKKCSPDTPVLSSTWSREERKGVAGALCSYEWWFLATDADAEWQQGYLFTWALHTASRASEQVLEPDFSRLNLLLVEKLTLFLSVGIKGQEMISLETFVWPQV